MERFIVEDFVVGTVTMFIVYGIIYLTVIKRNRAYHLAWGFKVFCFIAYNLFLAKSFGGGDSFYYHDVGIEYWQMIRSLVADGDLSYLTTGPFWSPMGEQTGRMFSLTGLLLYPTYGSYLAASAVCCGIGFAGQVFIHRGLRIGLPAKQPHRLIDFGCLYLPSLVFWSSGLLKDPLGMMGLGLAYYSWKRLQYDGYDLRNFIRLAIGYYCVFLFRVQLFPCLLAAVACSLLVRSRATVISRRASIGVASICLVAAALFVWFKFGVENEALNIRNAPLAISQGAASYADTGYSHVGDVSEFDSWTGLSIRAPLAIANTLFRPFPWDVRSVLMGVAALENIVILWITILLIGRWPKIWNTERDPLQKRNAVFAAVFVATLCAVVGASTLNFGSTSRYRIPALPFLFGLVALGSDRRRGAPDFVLGVAGARRFHGPGELKRPLPRPR